jgi:hypothetical protein
LCGVSSFRYVHEGRQTLRRVLAAWLGSSYVFLNFFFVFPCNSFDWELYWLMYNIHLFACAGEKTWQWNNPSERCILRWTNYLCSVPTSGNSEAWGRRILQFLAVDCQVNTTLQPKN